MDFNIINRAKKAWNVFSNRDPTKHFGSPYSNFYSYRPDRPQSVRGIDRTIVTSIYSRFSIDAAEMNIRHVRVDENGNYVSSIDSKLNDRMTFDANYDQTAKLFWQDVVYSLMEEGSVAILPTYTDTDLDEHDNYQIYEWRTARILQWYPRSVRIEAYNDNTGEKEELVVDKTKVAIIESPFYALINNPNTSMQRLIHKLGLLDAIDEHNSSGKLDLLIQLPYATKSPIKQSQAGLRRAQIEEQLVNSKYGIAYIDGAEKITQLNRPVENNLMTQIEYLTNMVYSQLGITSAILDGTADPQTMLNYYNRLIYPILAAITTELERKFLSKTARTQKQAIKVFRNPFHLVPVNDLAEIADKFTRNEILSPNEIRQIIGMTPSKDPKADKLENRNISRSESTETIKVEEDNTKKEEQNQNEEQV